MIENNSFQYRAPSGVTLSLENGHPVLSTRQGGKIAIDAILAELWQRAQECTMAEILDAYQGSEHPAAMLRAGLACLAEADLLERTCAPVPPAYLTLTGPLVSAVMVGYNSRDWFEESLSSLFEQTYQPLEVIVVENGSVDGSEAWLHEHYPQVKVIRQESSVSFAHANNLGIAAARGEYIFLLNPDVRMEPDAVAQMVQVAQNSPEPAIVNPRLRFWWATSFLNAVGNRVGPFSWGTDNCLGHLDLGQFDEWTELPSACFAAVLFSKAVIEKVGLLDENFPMYYEDSEWCYRARLQGIKVLPAHHSIVYHAFGGKVPGGEKDDGLTPKKLRNVAYGRYRFAIKIVDEGAFRFLGNYWLEDWANFTRLVAKQDFASAGAYLKAWGKVAGGARELLQSRRALHPKRLLRDEQLFEAQRNMPETLVWNGLPELTWDLIQQIYLPLIRAGRTRLMPEFNPTKPANRRQHLLIISNDVVDTKMAGPGMRYLEMSRALRDDFEVTLAIPSETSLKGEGFRIVRYWEDRPVSLQVLVENCSVVLLSGYMIQKFPFLGSVKARRVIDFYDPFVLENLHYYLNDSLSDQRIFNRQAIDITNWLSQVGDFFICGNERQRDYWMGLLTAQGRVNPDNFLADSSLRTLIDIVGIGIPDHEPQKKPMLRGVHPQIPQDAEIVLWGGGIWNWLDPLTIIRAWPQVLRSHPQARLVFLGTRHPNPTVPRHEMAEKAEKLAEELGEKDRTIIFIEWVGYEDREALLSEANVTVTMHPIHVETRYSLRTRVLDSIWAAVPILITDGDVTSEWIREYKIGKVVPPFDAESAAQSLISILDHPKEDWKANFAPLQEQLHWKRVVDPLRRYVLEGKISPDRAISEEMASKGTNNIVPAVGSTSAPRSALARMRYIARTQGKKALLRRIYRHIQWRLNRI